MREVIFSNLRWEKDGETIDKALVDDKVTINFDVQDINNGERITIQIWEHDDYGEHDHVTDIKATVENGKVCKEWTVIYIEDNDDSKSAHELKEKGYTLPEYHFTAKYRDVVSEESGVL